MAPQGKLCAYPKTRVLSWAFLVSKHLQSFYLLPDMASSRLPRFVMEVAPPQFVTVMRQRTRKMLDTINEEDNLEGSKSLSSTTIPAGATMVTAAASSSSATTATAHSNQLLRLNAFRGKPTSSVFEWHFTPNHNSSADSSTSVGSDFHLVSLKFHLGHG
ncbi:hypothetical protein J1N35_039127 [Gossypium stocksii]|uniref:Uncharacterized protein n=1 Tax=Gossypium stocksii TaxID=47602 RepID=A0A9D3UN70_9ROSI|nr:hypothetical protein J1N35_039127 [Gossypium stocksii]